MKVKETNLTKTKMEILILFHLML